MQKDFTEIIINNKTYSKLNKNIYSMLHTIEKFIPKTQAHLLDELESLYSEQASVAEGISYQQGLIDAQRLNLKT